MNIIYASGGRRRAKRGGRVRIDATGLVEGETRWVDTLWARDVKVGRLCICEMRAEKSLCIKKDEEGRMRKEG